MDDKFIINKSKKVTFSISIDEKLQERLDEIALKSNRSRNSLIDMALRYALDNLKLEE
ncbi:MAG: hypothetical protein UU63_C0006G0017 [Candidatus Uhrbacteria bacterium GW2011_GWF2_41_430]|nr:MAG: hypothetical protein UU63_C0006G0017 [Candidatus Uhrbacteria bacterium GW2011_GWF2_41_430]